MHLACQEGMAPGGDLREKLDNLAACGYEGIEFGGGGLVNRVSEIKAATANHPIKPSTVCGGFSGCPLDADRAEREKALGDIKNLLAAAADIGAVGMIFVPLFGGPRIPDLSPYANPIQLEMELLYKLMDEMGHEAAKNGVKLLLEPLNRYETHLINRLEQGVAVCEKLQNEHVAIMADFFHMSIEEPDIPESIRKAGRWISHVHLADSNRQLPGYGHTDFKSGFRALKEIGFDKYMALECGIPGADRKSELKRSADFMRAAMSA